MVTAVHPLAKQAQFKNALQPGKKNTSNTSGDAEHREVRSVANCDGYHGPNKSPEGQIKRPEAHIQLPALKCPIHIVHVHIKTSINETITNSLHSSHM